jgi:hypothetical protein
MLYILLCSHVSAHDNVQIVWEKTTWKFGMKDLAI